MKTIRPHYSWSQHSTFKSSKLTFYKKYVLGQESRSNVRFDKGSEFGDYKEKKERPHWVTDPLLETVADLIPDLDKQEFELNISLFKDVHESEVPEWNKPLLMFLDSAMEDFTSFDEYKTGKVPWTQQMVDDHKQLDFYAVGMYLASGQTIIPTANLYWIETEDIDNARGELEVRYTGHVEKFERFFSEDDITFMIMEVLKTMAEIDQWVFEELELEDEFVNRYQELYTQMKEIESEMNLMKLEVQTQLNENGIQYAIGKAGKFSVSMRKNWIYSKELTELTKKYKDEITKKQKLEQKKNPDSHSFTESLRYTPSKN